MQCIKQLSIEMLLFLICLMKLELHHCQEHLLTLIGSIVLSLIFTKTSYFLGISLWDIYLISGGLGGLHYLIGYRT